MTRNNKRSILKSLTWRLVATLITGFIVYYWTGEAIAAASVMGIDVVIKLLAYYFHERAWVKVPYGQQHKGV